MYQVYRFTDISRERASLFGPVYLVGDEKKDLLIRAEPSGISWYRGGPGSKRLTGWITLQGGHSQYWPTDRYYIDPKSGKPLTGYQVLGGKHYYLGTGGCLEKAFYDFDGEYFHWREYDSGKNTRYYTKSGVFYTGKTDIGNSTYLFTSEGYLRYGMQLLNGKYYYFDRLSGRMAKGKTIRISSFAVKAGESGKLTFPKPKKPEDAKVRVQSNDKVVFSFEKVKSVTAYSLEYSTNKNFPAKKTTVERIVPSKSKKDVQKVKLANAEPGKKYYVRIRAYRNYKEHVVYGPYSTTVKAVKAKAKTEKDER
jgi:hypothetical protein